MAKGATHFEQVPMKLVAKIAKQNAQSARVKEAAPAQGKKT
jgi:hypothetical protein